MGPRSSGFNSLHPDKIFMTEKQLFDKKDGLYQWEILPEEERRQSKTILNLLTIFSVGLFVIFLFGLMINPSSLTQPIKWINGEWQRGGIYRFLAVVIGGTAIFVIGVFVVSIYSVWKRSTAKNPERYKIGQSGIWVTTNNQEKMYLWSEFKGYIRSIWYRGGLFEAVRNSSILPFLMPSTLKIRAEIDNSEIINDLLDNFIPDLTEKFHASWGRITILIGVLSVMLAVFAYGLFLN